MEKGMLPGKLRHRRQEGDGHGVEAIVMRSSSFMFESSRSCVIGGNMEAGHRQVAASRMNMCGSSTRCIIGGNMEEIHRRVATLVANMRHRAYHGGHTRDKGVGGASLSSRPALMVAIGVTRDGTGGDCIDVGGASLSSTCCIDDNGFKREINNNKIWEVIVGTNLVISVKSS
ncbi:unnamed protein product [Cuscuta europaea]|uniref:Uncharacterized protein n=1 Tax=Cuscuta europaea TaxID=41803 RepID=A0A9P1EG42_CUSEU|nr:unnamed protein product [Cuscuta europaea]